MVEVHTVETSESELPFVEKFMQSDTESSFEPLHSISEDCNIEKALQILDAKNWINAEEFSNPWGPYRITLVHLAAYRGNVELLERAAALYIDLYATDKIGKSALHYAAEQGHIDVVRWLLKRSDADERADETRPTAYSQLSLSDASGNTPLFAATYNGHLKCVRVLVDYGGSLAAETNDGESVICALLKYGARATDLFTDILNAQIDVKSATADVVVDFRVLAPYGELQMAVISALIKAVAPSMEKMRILHHPLLEAFLQLQWTRCCYYHYVLVAVQSSHVLFLTAYALILLEIECDSLFLRWPLLVSACLLLCHNLVQLFLVPGHYRKKIETWLSVICETMSVVLAVAGEFIPDVIIPVEENPEKNLNILDDGVRHPSWILQLAAFLIPFFLIQVQLTIAQRLEIGKYIFAFTTLLIKTSMVFMKCFSLISCFSVSFMILFSGKDQFFDTWKIIKQMVGTLVGNEDDDLYSIFEGISYAILLTNVSRTVFLIFVLLTIVALISLTIGLALSNMKSLEQEGHTRQLLNQAEFIIYCERVTSRWKFAAKLVPDYLEKFLSNNKIETQMELEWAKVYKKRPRGFSEQLLDRLFGLASMNTHLADE